MTKVFARGFLCALAGMVGWLLTEWRMPAVPNTPEWASAELTMVVVVIALIGFAGGVHQGLMRGGIRNVAMMGLLGMVITLVFGWIGYSLGGTLVNSVFGPGWDMGSAAIPARMLVFAVMGTFIGAGIGAAQLSLRVCLAGAFGGLVGGLLCGMVFDLIGNALSAPQLIVSGSTQAEVGGPGRAVLWTMVGLTVGMFSALFDSLTRQAWLRLVVGRNEGKEWPVESGTTTIGRDERAKVPLYGDVNVSALHAVIVRDSNGYVLHDQGSPMGTGHNGIRIGGPVILQPGDTVQIAGHQLQFFLRGAPVAPRPDGRLYPQPVMPVGTPGQTAPSSPHPTGGYPQTPSHPATQSSMPTQAFTPTPVAPAGFVLVAIEGPLTGHRQPLHAQLEIGRESTGLALVADPQASRHHAVLTPTPHGVTVQDLGSTNGTFVNGQRTGTATLHPGDVVQIGSTKFRIEHA